MSELPPILWEVYDYVRSQAPERVGRREVAEALGISYFAARYRLDKLVNIGRLDYDREVTPTGWVRRVWFLAVVKFVHYTVVGNTATKDKFSELEASCTLDYDVEMEEDIEEMYYKRAVVKINDWVTEMFNEREVKFSSETSRTPPSVVSALLDEGVEVSDIAYSWWWVRAGRTQNSEDDEGYITWDEAVPTGISGGWFTTGKRRRGR